MWGELRQREPRLELPRYLEAVRSLEECTVRSEDCIGRGPWEAAHSNEESAGKGKWLKSHDTETACACIPCHRYVDGNRHADRFDLMRRGVVRTRYLLFRQGRVKVIG